jgi:hypothetical protein
VHDIADLEARGIPGAFVASAEFASAVDSQSVALGVDVSSVFVTHPIQDRTDDEMRALARDAIAQLVDALTGS